MPRRLDDGRQLGLQLRGKVGDARRGGGVEADGDRALCLFESMPEGVALTAHGSPL